MHSDFAVLRMSPIRSILIVLSSVVLSLATRPAAARAESISLAGRKVVWPAAALTFPTGRFGTPDPSTNHAGHKTGFDAGLDLGYMLNDYLAIGIGGDYARFNMDFGADTTHWDYRSSLTTAMFGQVWIRAFFPGGYAHWRPYALFGIGLGRPTAKIESPNDPSVARIEFTVNTSVGVTGGIGVLVPVSSILSFSFEPRYRQISTKGSGMEELLVLHDGTSMTIREDVDGKPLHQKSNTTWWELRVGLALMIK